MYFKEVIGAWLTSDHRLFWNQAIYYFLTEIVVCALEFMFNPLKPELNPICYLFALLGAHHFLHVSRIRVKLLTFRLLM